MARRTTPLPSGPPTQGPAILSRICTAAGWSERDLVRAVNYSLSVRGNFNSISAPIPHGITALPPGTPVFEVRPRGGLYEVEIFLRGERISCLGGGAALMTAGITLPESVMIAAAGRPIAQVIQTALLDSPDFVITSAGRASWQTHTTFAFTMPNHDFPG